MAPTGLVSVVWACSGPAAGTAAPDRESGRAPTACLPYSCPQTSLARRSGEPRCTFGATLFRRWEEAPHRPTRDLDLLGFGADEAERIQRIFAELCTVEVEPDGLDFRPESVTVEPIRDGALYHGQRVKLVALLERTRVDLQVDSASATR